MPAAAAATGMPAAAAVGGMPVTAAVEYSYKAANKDGLYRCSTFYQVRGPCSLCGVLGLAGSAFCLKPDS